MRRILESCHVHDQNQVAFRMVSSERREMPVTRLLENTPRIRHNDDVIGTSRLLDNGLSELILGTGRVGADVVDIECVTDGQTDELLKSYTLLFNNLKHMNKSTLLALHVIQTVRVFLSWVCL